MPLSRLENFLVNTDGNILYVNPSDLDATDSFDNKGNSLTRPFVTIQRALVEAARFTYQTGQTVKASEMTEMARKRDSNMKANNIDYSWTLQGAFSVDLDPTRGGEHVHADYVMNYDDGENKAGVNTVLRFYIIDGKIVTVNQFNQSIIME